MAQVVYLMCAITCLFCAGLLIRAYYRNKSPLLLWSMLCFVCLSVNNILLFIDFMAGPAYDLSTIRAAVALLGVGVMLYGLIWDTV